MITDDQFDHIKHKPKPSLQDVAVLIVHCEQLKRINESQADELGKALLQLDRLQKRLKWYQQTSLKVM